MSEAKLRELLKKYLEGRATSMEKRIIEDWYDSLSRWSGRIVLRDSERDILRSTYWKSLSGRIPGAGIREPDRRVRRFPSGFALAACVVATMVVSLLFLHSDVGNSEWMSRETAGGNKEEVVIREICNESDVVQVTWLPDSSVVKLFPGSKLQLDQAFNIKERKIHLSGQAFFDISPDEKRPFYVFANEVVTRVLGTSFSVKAFPDDPRITVAVKSGRVSVYAGPHKEHVNVKSGADEIVLTPNQQAVYTRKDQKVFKTLVENPRILLNQEEVKKIRFEGEPVSEVFQALEAMYGVEIVFEKEIFSRCSITTTTVGKDLYERIDVICEITGATYEIVDAQIIISGTACN